MASEIRRKGFTLVELLVVIGIIGILVAIISLGSSGARRQARDDRRVADLRQVQQALQLYFLKCRMYPGDYKPNPTVPTVKECLGGKVESTPALVAADNPDSWNELTSTLGSAELGFGTIPNDPVPGRNYSYHVQLGTGVTPRAQCYILSTQFETEGHRALVDPKEIDDDASFWDAILPLSCSDPACKFLYPVVSNANFCDDANKEYCAGNIECFFGN